MVLLLNGGLKLVRLDDGVHMSIRCSHCLRYNSVEDLYDCVYECIYCTTTFCNPAHEGWHGENGECFAPEFIWDENEGEDATDTEGDTEEDSDEDAEGGSEGETDGYIENEQEDDINSEEKYSTAICDM